MDKNALMVLICHKSPRKHLQPLAPG